MKDKIRKAADKSKSYSQFAEAEDPKRCRNTKRHVAKANFGSLLKMKDQTFRSVIRKKNLKEFDVRIDCRSICGPKTAKYTLIAGLRGALLRPGATQRIAREIGHPHPEIAIAAERPDRRRAVKKRRRAKNLRNNSYLCTLCLTKLLLRQCQK